MLTQNTNSPGEAGTLNPLPGKVGVNTSPLRHGHYHLPKRPPRTNKVYLRPVVYQYRCPSCHTKARIHSTTLSTAGKFLLCAECAHRFEYTLNEDLILETLA